MRENNGGFTLAELLVSIAVAGILTVAAFSFMVAGSNIYESVGTRLDLRMDAQLAASQLEGYIIDCNENIYFDGEKLFIINRENGAYTAYVFERSGGSLTYAVVPAAKNPDGSYSCEYVAGDFMCGNVAGFSVEIYPSGDGGAAYAELELKLERSGTEQPIQKTVALRNRVTISVVS